MWEDYESPPYNGFPVTDPNTGAVITPAVPFAPPAYVVPAVVIVPVPPVAPIPPIWTLASFGVSGAIVQGYLPRTRPATRTIGSNTQLPAPGTDTFRVPAFAKSVRIYANPVNSQMLLRWRSARLDVNTYQDAVMVGFPTAELPVPADARTFQIINTSAVNVVNSYRAVFHLAL